MDEKIISEVRVVETEDGFRIEIKGDKERLKAMGFGPGMKFGPGMMGFMRGFKRGWGRGHRGRHHGHHGPHPGHYGPWWGGEGNDDEPIINV